MVTALVALLLLFMYLAPYVSPDASWVFSVLGLVAPVIYVSGLVLFLYWVIRWRWGYASPMLVLLLLGVPKYRFIIRSIRCATMVNRSTTARR